VKKLRDILLETTKKSSTGSDATLEIGAYLSKTTLDIIGLAGT